MKLHTENSVSKIPMLPLLQSMSIPGKSLYHKLRKLCDSLIAEYGADFRESFLGNPGQF